MNLKNLILLLFTLSFFSAFSQVKTIEKFTDFESKYLKNLSEDTTYVINFWATWCAPCVAELPYFEALNKKYQDKNFKLVLVTLDSYKTLETRVLPFIEKNNMKAEVVLLADSKTYKWIDLIDPSWSGAIPITLFLKGNERQFYEKDYENLEAIEKDLFKLYKN